MKRLTVTLGLIGLLFLTPVPFLSAEKMGDEGKMMPMYHMGMMGKEMMKGCPMMQGCPYMSSFGREGKGSREKGMEEMFKHKVKRIMQNAKELGLTSEQMKSLMSLKMSVKKDLVMRDAQIEVAGLDIKSQMMNDPLDVKAVNALIDKKYDLKKEKAKMLVNACAELKKILTDEQKEKIKAILMSGMETEQITEDQEEIG